MAPKATKSGEPKSERLELASAIMNITQIQDKFTKALEHLEDFKAETLNALDTQINTKKIELSLLKEEFEQENKIGEIRCKQHLAEFEYNGAIDLLEKKNEVPISKERLEEMEEELEKLRKDNQEELDALKKTTKEEGDKALKIAINNSNLVHKAEVAELGANAKQGEREIANLNATINNLRHELSEQRKLTKEVAEASKQGPINLSTSK
jgi:hypothetical protein